MLLRNIDLGWKGPCPAGQRALDTVVVVVQWSEVQGSTVIEVSEPAGGLFTVHLSRLRSGQGGPLAIRVDSRGAALAAGARQHRHAVLHAPRLVLCRCHCTQQ